MSDIVPQLAEIMDCLYRVAVKAVIIESGKLLVVQEDEGWYGLPGGGVDYTETIHKTLDREIQEELGIQIDTLEIDPSPAFVTNRGVVDKVPRFTLYYHVRMQTNDKATTTVSAELAHKWVDRSEFVNLSLQPNVKAAREFLLSQL